MGCKKGKQNGRFFAAAAAVAGMSFLSLIVFLSSAREAKSALIDWTKHEEWRRKQLEALVTEVRLSGSAPYVVMSFREYDTNRDGRIDNVEVEVIKDILREPIQKRPKK